MLSATRRVPLFFYRYFLSPRCFFPRRVSLCAIVFLLCAATFPCGQAVLASASHRESEIAYAHAENLRRHLHEKPLASRTREDYERVLDAYRAVYHGDPASPDAGRSIAAVAELLAGEGRVFHEEKLLHDAVAQWEFLRREYPGSPLRERALFQEAQIEQDDLQDRAAAKKLYRSFLRLYPRDELATQARAGLDGREEDDKESTRNAAVVRDQGNPVRLDRRETTGSSTPPRSTRDDKAIYQTTSAKRIAGVRPSVSRPSAPSSDAVVATIHAVRYWAEGNSTRLAVDLSAAVPYHAYLSANGKQITMIFFGAHLSESLTGHRTAVDNDANLRAFHAVILTGDQVELVLDLAHAVRFSSFTLPNPDRIILNIQGDSQSSPARSMAQVDGAEDAFTHAARSRFAAKAQTGHRAVSTSTPANIVKPSVVPVTNMVTKDGAMSSGTELSADPAPGRRRSMARVLGLRIRRIVIDAGHGGYDSGTLGPGGVEEKEIALDVALRLGHLLQRRLGADVIYTRQTDKFVRLEDRTAMANRAHADLFLSIHANSSSDPDVRGVETYFLNFTGSPDALQVAARENAMSDRSVHELSDLVRKITLSDKIDESREFAADVQASLYNGLASGNAGIKNRGVKQAPFAVLIGANMPSVLAEISFLTNPQDAEELADPAYRERLAEALYRGVAQYVDGMSGVRVAKTNQPQALVDPAEPSAE